MPPKKKSGKKKKASGGKKKASGGEKKASGGKKKGVKKKGPGKKKSKKAAKEEAAPWVPGPNDPHSERCKCRVCQLGEEFARIEVKFVSPSAGGSERPQIEEVELPGVIIPTLAAPEGGGHHGDFAIDSVHLTPFYKVVDLRDAVAERACVIPSEVTLYASEEDARESRDPMPLLAVLADEVEGGAEDEPPTVAVCAVTTGRRFGYASRPQGYLSTGAPLLLPRERVLVGGGEEGGGVRVVSRVVGRELPS